MTQARPHWVLQTKRSDSHLSFQHVNQTEYGIRATAHSAAMNNSQVAVVGMMEPDGASDARKWISERSRSALGLLPFGGQCSCDIQTHPDTIGLTLAFSFRRLSPSHGLCSCVFVACWKTVEMVRVRCKRGQMAGFFFDDCNMENCIKSTFPACTRTFLTSKV